MMPAATDAFSELICPFMGIESVLSQFFSTSWETPSPSAPMTMATAPVRSAS